LETVAEYFPRTPKQHALSEYLAIDSADAEKLGGTNASSMKWGDAVLCAVQFIPFRA
jgi:hypothetical protein